MARVSGLTDLARVGFSDLERASVGLDELSTLTGIERAQLLTDVTVAADADEALDALVKVARRDAEAVRVVMSDGHGRLVAWRLLGASRGFGTFYLRRPTSFSLLVEQAATLPTAAALQEALLAAVGARAGFSELPTDEAVLALRIAYREQLARIAAFDLLADDPVEALKPVAAALADAAGAALEASLAIARTSVTAGMAAHPRERVAATRFAIIGMGKAGARELNYVSDVDVIFVAGSADEDVVTEQHALQIANRLAILTMRGISEVDIEPPLWEVDANLRPEGKQGALVRTLTSHEAYYDRWAHTWEFQALLKARPLAGDPDLGAAYVAMVSPRVWTIASHENFVENVQRMRERVTDHIPPADVPYQLKLGPGGIRDIEFTVQLLQLVHGVSDDALRARGTLDALDALVAGGYIGREDGAAFARDYRVLRVMEHRLQLGNLARTHLMPRTETGMRVLARSSGLADGPGALTKLWDGVKREVRDIHVRLFYRPLLSAVAAIPEDQRSLTTDEAEARLRASGFRNPRGALGHIRALTSGISRRANIQRHLMPVMLRWFEM
ncbi:MAG: bifunctional [glutamine synthetase] adenylyltransferase/[glutamine synthetase]-adenylyl-L-tyrosine phosphorylase, partial [Microbacterium sp.]